MYKLHKYVNEFRQDPKKDEEDILKILKLLEILRNIDFLFQKYHFLCI